MNSLSSRLIGWIRRRKHAFLVAYTLMFVVTGLVCLWPFIDAGKHLMWNSDGLQAHFVRFTGFGRWVRQIIKQTINAGTLVVPQWDLTLGYGSDLPVYLGSYFGNPFNCISILLPTRLSEWGFDSSIVLQLYVAGLTFGMLAKEHGMSRFQMLVGSTCYAFSGWAIVGLEQYVFVYPLVLFPLLLIGAERVFKRESPLLFVVAATSFFLFYFYFAYMACLLLVPYCVLLFLQYEARDVKLLAAWVIRFVCLIALCACIASVLLCPWMMGLLGQERLGLDRDVPLLYSLKTYANYLQGMLVYVQGQENSAFSWGPLGLSCLTLLFSRHGRRGLKASVVFLSAIALLPMAGSVLNGFQYASNRWMWAYALCIAYVIAEMLPSLEYSSVHDLTRIVVVASALGVILNLRPDDQALLEYPRLLAGMCGLMTIVALVGIAALNRSHGDGGSRSTVRLLTCVGVTLLLAIPYHYVVSKRYLSVRVDAGEAWNSYVEQPVATSVAQIRDDDVWRYDYNDVAQLKNTTFMTQVPGFNVYSNLYDQRVDRLSRDMELSDDQRFQVNLNLCSRSFLEASLGAKYFVVGSAKDAKSEQLVPKTKWLPYGAKTQPLLSSADKGGSKGAAVYTNELALPLAYTHSHTISISQYEELTAAQKQQLLLQAVALDDQGEDGLETELDDIEFLDKNLAYDIVATSDGTTVENNTIVTREKNATITLKLANETAGETYVEFVGMTYDNPQPAQPEALTRKSIKDYSKRKFEWSHENRYVVKAKSNTGGSGSIANYTRYYHMYAGDNTNALNLGYSTTPTTEVTITFVNVGTYDFDAINVIVQPVDNLKRYVDERRTYPVDLSMHTNSFTASVNNDEPQVLFFSIPWSRGWSATVDDEPAEVMEADGVFMAVNLSAGKHVVKLHYETPGLKLGLVLSIVGVVLAAIVLRQWERLLPRRRA